MTERQYISSGAEWEEIHGYSRAVRVGSAIYVSGTVGLESDGSAAPSAYRQAKRALQIICDALTAFGAKPEDVVRTRVFVTDVSQFEEIARAHSEVFGAVRPASTMVEVSRLIGDEFVVEIEVDAVIEAP